MRAKVCAICMRDKKEPIYAYTISLQTLGFKGCYAHDSCLRVERERRRRRELNHKL
jgi:hypothetical protein